jgi:hypothetical protein
MSAYGETRFCRMVTTNGDQSEKTGPKPGIVMYFQ